MWQPTRPAAERPTNIEEEFTPLSWKKNIQRSTFNIEPPMLKAAAKRQPTLRRLALNDEF